MSEKSMFPPLTQEPLMHVDATPDEGYARRILEAHLHNAKCRYASDPPEEIWRLMNEAQEKRERLLTEAIRKLG